MGSGNERDCRDVAQGPLWSGLTQSELKVIARSFKEIRYESGDVIARKGGPDVGLYLIVHGAVEVRTDGRVLSKLGPGQFLGEDVALGRSA
jgi:signal-transduction protein with cAMP-binding, CBS, and nucleotidyltransferase domain